MARWDAILSLDVQNPPTLEFSSLDLVWSKVEGWHDKLDRVALIPYARVDDFVRGESSNKDCPTRFHVEARRRRPPETTCKPKVDGIIEYILYWCSFGPDDHRKGGIVRPSRTTYVPKKKNAGRPNTKRGCTCHFIVKRLIAEPTVALIIYNDDKHVDKKGLPCHGPQDKKAAGTRAMFAPYISEDLRLRVLSLLHVGVSVETIMQRHNELVERQGGPSNRDDLLTHRYVRRQERAIRRSTYELDEDDALSVGMWVESHQSNVFFYEDFSDSDPLTLGIQTEWQLQQMIKFGNRSLLASDSRFGTNKMKYPIHSLLVFNSDKKAIPVAWIIAPRFSSLEAHKWMRALYNRVHTKDPTWKLAGFIVDDPLADVLTIRDVFQCSVLVSFWRVRHAWHKNIVKKCLSAEMEVEISRRLGEILNNICRGEGNLLLFEHLVEDFIDEPDFMDYFKATWYPRLDMWSTALQTYPLASCETCAAIEFYHNQLKLRLLNENELDVYQRADWLVDKLGTKVHSYFWLDEYSGKDDFARYWKNEWTSGLTSWRKALNIPDSDVIVEGRYAKVNDQLDSNQVYTVHNPGSLLSICDCSRAKVGYLCEHVLKATNIYRKKKIVPPSVSIFQYHQALIKMLHCPPYDSLIRDHAVSMAVSVQMLLNALDPESGRAVGNYPEKGSSTKTCRKRNRDDDESQECTNAFDLSSNTASHDCQDGPEGPNDETLDVIIEVVEPIPDKEGNCAENAEDGIQNARHDNLHDYMDIDPSPISTSPPNLDSVAETNADNALNVNEKLSESDGNDNIENTMNESSRSSAMDLDSATVDISTAAIDFVEKRIITKQSGTENDHQSVSNVNAVRQPVVESEVRQEVGTSDNQIEAPIVETGGKFGNMSDKGGSSSRSPQDQPNSFVNYPSTSDDCGKRLSPGLSEHENGSCRKAHAKSNSSVIASGDSDQDDKCSDDTTGQSKVFDGDHAIVAEGVASENLPR